MEKWFISWAAVLTHELSCEPGTRTGKEPAVFDAAGTWAFGAASGTASGTFKAAGVAVGVAWGLYSSESELLPLT